MRRRRTARKPGARASEVAANGRHLLPRWAEVHLGLAGFAIAERGPQDLVAAARDALAKRFPHDDLLVHPVAGDPPRDGSLGSPRLPRCGFQDLADRVLRTGRECCLGDTRRSRSPLARALFARGVGSALAVPCPGPDGPLAAIALGRHAPRSLGEGEHALLCAVAAHLGGALHAALRRDALQRSLHSLQESQGQRVRTERLAAVGQMAAGVAHDFNNMLAGIMVRAELLRHIITDAEALSHVEVIERAAHDGAQTVRRLQEFTRQETGRDFRPVDLNAAVRESLEITESRWKDDTQLAGIAIDVRTDLGEIPPVAGEASEIREVLTNLIVNAVDAMPRGGVLRLATRWAAGGSRVEVRVSDTGTGMAEQVRAQIFEPFFTTKGSAGSGLGLSVSYGIVKRHGGSIQVETAPGEGTTFTVSLPAMDRSAAAEAGGNGTGEEASAAPRRPLRILVVDDEESFRVSLYSALRREGHFVAVAGSGEEGLRLFRISTFDVVLTDLGMPGLGGWQVARAVKRLRRRTPVVLITGWGVTVGEADRRRPEVDAILAKPVTSKALLQVLARLPLGPPGGRRDRGRGPRAGGGGGRP